MDIALADFLDQSQLSAVIGFLSALSRALLAIESERAKATMARKVSGIIGSTILAVIISYIIKQIRSGPEWAPFCAAAAVGILAQHLMMRIVRSSEGILDAVEDNLKSRLHKTHPDDNDTKK